ncbi:hypothetical protein BKA70DRAFT_1237849 [Coprinopsis sp. MPI-PUGE-AT-0042]|nr:hypothetical protein BKA70DRAFT_1237849 [Coprinopsis sp. MPI-PUGE-AT-0042]
MSTAPGRSTLHRGKRETGKADRQENVGDKLGLRVSESGAIDRNGSGTEGMSGSLRIRKRNGRMSGPKSIPKVSWMAKGFGSGPEARECSGTWDMGRKRAEAGRSSVAQRQRQGDGIEQRWDGWGSDEVQPASVVLQDEESENSIAQWMISSNQGWWLEQAQQELSRTG